MNLEQVVSEMDEIPSAPRILPKLQAILRNPHSDIGDITSLLKVDVSLAAKILRLANSSYFAGAAPASGLDNAIQRIGLREINRLVSLAVSKGVLDVALPAYNAKEGELLETSLCCAQLMHSLAKEIGPDELDTYYTAGLFHGVGKLVINQYLRPRGLTLYGGHDGAGESMQDIGPEVETKILGFDHTEAGAAFLTSWQFPQDIVDPIRFQISPQTSESHRKISHALHFSRNTASLLSVVSEVPDDVEVSDELLSTLEIEKKCLLACMTQAHAEYNLIKSSLLN